MTGLDHDELDSAVLDAYGLEPTLEADAILWKLVAINAERAAEEGAGSDRPGPQPVER